LRRLLVIRSLGKEGTNLPAASGGMPRTQVVPPGGRVRVSTLSTSPSVQDRSPDGARMKWW